jgi:hypothetical protein
MELVVSNETVTTDWYTQALNDMIEDGADETGLTRDQFNDAYTFLFNLGLIDYDIEKEILAETYGDLDN